MTPKNTKSIADSDAFFVQLIMLLDSYVLQGTSLMLKKDGTISLI